MATSARHLVVVLEHGIAVTMPWLDQTPAVLAAWYPGVQGGPAIANVLFGDVNPSGTLPLSFPRSEADLPQTTSPTHGIAAYTEGLRLGDRWFDAQAFTPLFHVGQGLSCTTFACSGLASSTDGDGNVTVQVALRNTGTRSGAEVVQVHASLPPAAGAPPKRLVGWQKLTLSPGASTTLSITVPARRFAVWDVGAKGWRVLAGNFGLQVGGSSAEAAQVESVSLPGRRP